MENATPTSNTAQDFTVNSVQEVVISGFELLSSIGFAMEQSEDHAKRGLLNIAASQYSNAVHLANFFSLQLPQSHPLYGKAAHLLAFARRVNAQRTAALNKIDIGTIQDQGGA